MIDLYDLKDRIRKFRFLKVIRTACTVAWFFCFIELFNDAPTLFPMMIFGTLVIILTLLIPDDERI